MARMKWLATAALGLALACDGSSTSTSDGGSLPTPDATLGNDAEAQHDAAPHDAADTSDAQPLDDTTPFGACRRYFQAFCSRYIACQLASPSGCMQADLCPDVMFAPGSNWTIEKAHACAPEWATVSCEDLASERRPSCDALPGSFEVGHSCIVRMQCQSGLCSESVQYGGKCGECAKIAAPGETCNFDTVRCPLGQSCEGGACVVRPLPQFGSTLSAGDVCTGLLGCQAGLGCSALGDAGTGTCLALPAVGEPCLPTFNGTGQCARNASCDAPTRKCVALPKVGESCAKLPCDDRSTCATQLLGTPNPTSICVPRQGAGQTCYDERFIARGPGRSQPCAEGLECMRQADVTASTICATPRELGESCDDTLQLCRYGTHCDLGKCVANADSTLYDAICKP